MDAIRQGESNYCSDVRCFDRLCSVFPELHPGLVKTVEKLLSGDDKDFVKVREVRDKTVQLPSSSDAINLLLLSLEDEVDPEIIVSKLAQVVFSIRLDRELRSKTTTQGDFVVADIETNVRRLLNVNRGRDSRILYPWIRELVDVMPKLQVFGLGIHDLREDIASYQEDRLFGDPFEKVCESIREAIHQRLSNDAIFYIDEFIAFLHSDKRSEQVAFAFCEASQDQKQHELTSPLYQTLLSVRERLRMIWNVKSDTNSFSSVSRDRSTGGQIEAVERIIDWCREFISDCSYGNEFLHSVERDIEVIRSQKDADVRLGFSRFYLKKIIEAVMTQRQGTYGDVLFELITLDSLLENLSIAHYSVRVNVFGVIDERNFFSAVKVNCDLALCARAMGQGTKSLGRLALLMERNTELANVFTIGEMQRELADYIGRLKHTVESLIVGPVSGNTETIDRKRAKILNDTMREKTTHLFGNMLAQLQDYLGRVDPETAETYAKACVRRVAGGAEKMTKVEDMLFKFGPDLTYADQTAHKAWHMGGKGASLAEVSQLIIDGKLQDVFVPYGFGLGTKTWSLVEKDLDARNDLCRHVSNHLYDLEQRTGKKFCDGKNPLLLAVRSGAIISLPGALSTVAHIGLNEDIVQKWAETLDEPFRAYFAYVRFLFNYAESVLGISLDCFLQQIGISHIIDLLSEDVEVMKAHVLRIKNAVSVLAPGRSIPDDGYQQLHSSIIAVFQSYGNEKIQSLLKAKQLPAGFQSACLIQECLPVRSSHDCSGVYLTRNPDTGGNGNIEFVNEFGEDLVGGRVVPYGTDDFLEKYPDQAQILSNLGHVLETRYTHPNDIEFAVRDGRVYFLQSRKMPLSPMATVVSAYSFFSEKKLDITTFLSRTKRIASCPLRHTYLSEADKIQHSAISHGASVNRGVSSGRLYFDEAKVSGCDTGPVIFFTKNNLPSRFQSLPQIGGYVAEEGGVTSHAALVSIGKVPCVIGVEWRRLSENTIKVGDRVLSEGDFVTLDANDGLVYEGQIPVHEALEDDADFIRVRTYVLRLLAQQG